MAKHILVADDSVTIQRVVQITFANEDFTVVMAKSVDEALGKAREKRPDLVLADAVMPGKTGYDLCSAVKADAALRGVPVMVMSSQASPYDEVKGRQVGADGFIQKPFDTQAMLDKAAEIIGKGSKPSAGVPVAATPAPAPVPVPAPVPHPAPTPILAPKLPTPTVSPAAVRTPIAMPFPPAPAPVPAPIPVPVPVPRPVAAPLPSPPPGLPRPPMLRGAPVPGAARPMVPPQASQPAQAAQSPGARTGAPPVSAARAATAPPARSQTVMGLPQMVMPPARPVAPAVVPRPPVTPMPAMPAATLVPPSAMRPPATPSSGSPAAVAPMVAAVAQAAVSSGARGPEYEALTALSREVIERMCWEIIPELAEVIIREHVDRLAKK